MVLVIRLLVNKLCATCTSLILTKRYTGTIIYISIISMMIISIISIISTIPCYTCIPGSQVYQVKVLF